MGMKKKEMKIEERKEEEEEGKIEMEKDYEDVMGGNGIK